MNGDCVVKTPEQSLRNHKAKPQEHNQYVEGKF